MMRGLGEPDRTLLLDSMHRHRYQAGEFLMRQGEPGDTLHLIEAGHVAAQVTTGDGLVATLNLMGPGDVLGEMSLVEEGGVRTASIVAVDRVETLALARPVFERLRVERPEIDRFLITLLVDHVVRLSAQLRDAYVASAETRIVRRLLALAISYRVGDRPIEVPVDQGTLARLAGASRQTANRVLRSAQDEGWLVIGRRRLEITDFDRLLKRAESGE